MQDKSCVHQLLGSVYYCYLYHLIIKKGDSLTGGFGSSLVNIKIICFCEYRKK